MKRLHVARFSFCCRSRLRARAEEEVGGPLLQSAGPAISRLTGHRRAPPRDPKHRSVSPRESRGSRWSRNSSPTKLRSATIPQCRLLFTATSDYEISARLRNTRASVYLIPAIRGELVAETPMDQRFVAQCDGGDRNAPKGSPAVHRSDLPLAGDHRHSVTLPAFDVAQLISDLPGQVATEEACRHRLAHPPHDARSRPIPRWAAHRAAR